MSVSAPTFDLQSHSRHSDGALAPAEVVAAAAQAGVRLLALTDHDTVDGVREAAAAAERAGIRLVTGVEVSTIDAGGQDLHILGYLVDDRDPVLLDRLHSYRQAREHRAAAIVEALGDLGFAVEESRLRERAAAGKSVGRPHLAEAVVHHPANRERLATEGLLEPSAFLVAYLIEGRPAFRPRQAPSVEDAVGVIHGAGGVAVWAHPFWDVSAPAEVLARLERFVAAGLDGVECFYPTHSPEQAGMLADRCAELGLLSTGSADFHGPRHREFSHFRAFSTYGHEAALGPIAG